jgi:tRNA nucleotidyltransferase (CCA-adding enzyme)
MNNLPEERLMLELEKCLVQADEPSRFFQILDDIGALKTTFPELHELTGVVAGPPNHHKEDSTFKHTMMVLDEMKQIRPDDELAMLMAIAHDLGKGVTDEDQLPSHPTHAKNGPDVATELAERLSMSRRQRRAMRKAARLHMRFHDIDDLRESTVIEMVENCRESTLNRLRDLAVADSRGRIPSSEVDTKAIDRRLEAARQACDEWTGERLIENGFDPADMGGKEFGDLLRQRRVEKMREVER